MIVSNTSPLIHLAKAGRLSLLEVCFSVVLIPKSVFDEILRYPQSPEALAVKRAVDERWIKIGEIHKVITGFTAVAKAELDAISLALQEKKAILIDDQAAVKIAQLFGINVYGTLYTIIKSVKSKHLSQKEAIAIVHQMMGNEFYLSSDVYALFLEKLKEIR